MKLLEKIENGEEVSEDLISLLESAFFISYPDVGTFMIQKLKKFIWQSVRRALSIATISSEADMLHVLIRRAMFYSQLCYILDKLPLALIIAKPIYYLSPHLGFR